MPLNSTVRLLKAMVYSYPATFIWGTLILALLIAFYSWHVWRNKENYLGPIALSLIFFLWAPQLFVHELRLENDQVQWKGGYWWRAKSETLRFVEVASVCTTIRLSGRGTTKVWWITYKNGTKREFLLSDLWSLNSAEIEAAMRQRGVSLCGCHRSDAQPLIPPDPRENRAGR
jgi:hypothetical protein